MSNEEPKYVPCYRSHEGESIERRLECRSCKGTGIRLNPRAIICNGCGGNLADPDGNDDSGFYGTNGPILVSGGYSSPHFTDGRTYEFAMCELCLRNLFSSFKVPPKVGSYMGGGKISYEEDHEDWKVRSWVRSGGRKEILKNTSYCNHDEDCMEEAAFRRCEGGYITDEKFCEKHASESYSWTYGEWVPLSFSPSLRKKLNDEFEDGDPELVKICLEALKIYEPEHRHIFFPYAPRLIVKGLQLPGESGNSTVWSILLCRKGSSHGHERKSFVDASITGIEIIESDTHIAYIGLLPKKEKELFVSELARTVVICYHAKKVGEKDVVEEDGGE